MTGFLEYEDMTEEQREEQVQALLATFIALPGVVGAPLVMGPDYYREIAIHQVEAGVRVPAKPIKHYVPPTSLRSAGTWVYDNPATAPEDPHERFKRMAEEENAAYLAEVARRKAEKSATPSASKSRRRQ